MPTRLLIGGMLAMLPALSLFAQEKDDFRGQILTLERIIQKNHYSPRNIDDGFSQIVFDNLIRKLDPDTLYFSPHAMLGLQPFRSQIDDELNGNGWVFLPKLIGLYSTSLQQTDSALSATASQTRTAVQKRELNARRRSIKKILNNPSGLNQYVVSSYCDAIANAFDPHSEYMPLREKQSFESALGTEGYYFGLSVRENDNGDLEIDRLAAGSPAWKCGDLNKGDILVKVAWEGKEAIDLSGADEYEFSELLSAANDMKMHLTVRKANGVEKTASLTKERMKNEENTITSAVFDDSVKTGYIYLPDFYTSMGGASGSCANDVAREIIKLKKQNIRALVLDLRFNGGGSLTEALDMAGIFINDGPLSMLRDRAGKAVTLKDMNRGTIYDGPMAVLVNAQSASASELLAAVLQDYHRAVIIGSPTFGKGTAQIIIPVDTASAPNRENPPYGFVKLTTSKFYRVNGTTTQHAGVVPDILLPDLFDDIDYHEHAYPTALTADTIAKNNYYKPLAALPVETLAMQSRTRVRANPQFANAKRSFLEAGEDIYIKEAAAILNDLIKTQPNK